MSYGRRYYRENELSKRYLQFRYIKNVLCQRVRKDFDRQHPKTDRKLNLPVN